MKLSALTASLVGMTLASFDAYAAFCKLEQRARLFSASEGTEYVRMLAADEVLRLDGDLVGDRVEVKVVETGDSGFLDVVWAKQVCDFEAVSSEPTEDNESVGEKVEGVEEEDGAGDSEEAGASDTPESTETTDEAEADASPDVPESEDETTEDAKTSTAAEVEVPQGSEGQGEGTVEEEVTDAKPEMSSDPPQDEPVDANSDSEASAATQESAASEPAPAPKQSDTAVATCTLSTSIEWLPDDGEESPVVVPSAGDTVEVLKVEENRAHIKLGENVGFVSGEAIASQCPDLTKPDEDALPAAESVDTNESADDNEPGSDSEMEEPRQLNESQLPSIARSEPRIYEPLIGRDAVKRVVVLDTRIDEAITEPLDGGGMGALIAAELQNLSDGKFEVVARADLMALVTRLEQAQLMGCADESCMTDIGALAEASYLVASSVTQAGEGKLLTVELLDALSGKALRREAVTWTGDTKGLVELCAPQTARLVDAEKGQSHSGSIQIVANEDGAEVYVDELLAGETPIDIFANLDIGSHKITVKKDGYNLFEMPVVVGRGQTSLVQAELIRPWYKEWWVWTAAGAVLTTAVLSFALSGDEVIRQEDLPDTVIGVDTSVDTGTGR